MLRPILFLCLSGLAAAQDPAPLKPVATLLKDGDAAYLKGDYETARQSFLSAWEQLDTTPPENPVRYDTLRRLANVRAASGEFKEADEWLQKAIEWRSATLGPRDPKIADDLLISISYQRALKNWEIAMSTIRRVESLHVAIYGFDSTMVADDYHRTAQIFMEMKKPEPAISSLQTAFGIRTRLAGPLAGARSRPPRRDLQYAAAVR
jgi:tetratricopeptide (TPR) repeat protein